VGRVETFDIESRQLAKGKEKVKFKGVAFVPETEQQIASNDSDDDVPLAMLLRPKTAGSLTLEQIQECKEGPLGDKTIGKTVAKTFDGVKYTGIVDRFRTERKRHIYHVTYNDGDEEEWSQRELRDGYLLGLSPEIEAQWKTLKKTPKDKEGEDTEVNNDEKASDGEGSLYDGDFEEEQAIRKAKRRRKEKKPRSSKQTKRGKAQQLSGLILPQQGDKSVAAEAFQKLSSSQQLVVADNINRKTKKVSLFTTWQV
jgi:hypothetical protein